MRSKKLLYVLVLVIAIIASSVMTSTVYADTVPATQIFGLEEFRKATTEGDQYGYRVLNQNVWKIVKYENGGTAKNYDTSTYCLRAGYGFYTQTPGSFSATYGPSANFRVKSSIDSVATIHTDLYNNYKNVLWILDNSYVPTSVTATEDRIALLTAAGINTSSELTDDDIEVIQQLAVWYFTNESETLYHKDFAGEPQLNNVFQLIKNKGTEYQNIEDVNRYRYADMEDLYKYFVTQAKNPSNLLQYDYDTSIAPISLAAGAPTAVYNEETFEYEIGPYKIDRNNNTPYNATAVFKDQNGTVIPQYTSTTTGTKYYKMLDADKHPINKTIDQMIGQTFYITMSKSALEGITSVKFDMSGTYKTSQMIYWTIAGNNLAQPLVEISKVTNPIIGNNSVGITIKEEHFDLALRKFVSQVNTTTYDRAPKVNAAPLISKTGTTAIYEHTKAPVPVKKGDIVTYTIRIYNEGDVDGYVGEITDYLPIELDFINDLTKYPEETRFNASNGWIIDPSDSRKIRTQKLAYSSNIADADKNANNIILAFDGVSPKYKEVQVKCKVKDIATSLRKITNLAQITAATDSRGRTILGKGSISTTNLVETDSVPNGEFNLPSDTELPTYRDTQINRGDKYIEGQEDDDDFEKLKLEEFDLSLRKFISAIDNVTVLGREAMPDVTPLKNQTSTTAIYNHTKQPQDVKREQIVTYTIRIYNEAEIPGYAYEIKDYLPEELEFIKGDPINDQYEWDVSEDGRTVTTTYLSKLKETATRTNLIRAFNGTTLDYKEVKINCKVKNTATYSKNLTNLAEITQYKDYEGKEVIDRDSPKKITKPSDADLPSYKNEEIDRGDRYIEGQEDDDDFEKIRIVYFDLALRKFITGIEAEKIDTRIPTISLGEDGKLKYEHTKTPIEVVKGNTVTYTIRVYNEGLINGYANEIVDDVPEGLVFLPENEKNIEYRWTMYKELKEEENKEEIFEYGNKKYIKTEKAEEADIIRTDYLSKEQEKTSKGNMIKAFNAKAQISETNPDYKEIEVRFKVTEPNTSDRIIINTAEIADDRDETNSPIDDVDSKPSNENEWNKEDDLDKEFIKVKYFDLALKKWVSKVILIEKGEQTVTETGHTGDEDPEPVVKVDLHRKKINDVTVKFEFQIKITNEGQVAGHATEITDYIPEGLKFVKEDNPNWYTRETLNGRERVATRLLENTLLQPGETANVPIILTWINDGDNMGVKVNIAEISEDDNDDIDSTPDNFKEKEDDQDDAPVMLSIELGQERIYYGLGFIVLFTLFVGIVLIKRFVI